MELFKTDMLRFHPPATRRGFDRRPRSRYGCRSARGARPCLEPQPLTAAVRLALASMPALATLPAVGEEAGNEVAAA